MQDEVVEGFQLSPQQKHVWLTRKETGLAMSQCAVLLEGELDPVVLKQSVLALLARHESLRTRFESLPGVDFPLQVPSDDLPAEYREIDLSEVGTDRHVLRLNVPALCADRASLINLVNEIAPSYEAFLRGETLPGEPVQYIDYCAWLEDLLQSEEGEADKEYWRKLVAEIESNPALDLPFGGEVKDVPEGSASLSLVLDEQRVQELEQVARQSHVTIATLLLAGWQTLLWRLTGANEIVVDCLSDGRRIEHLQKAVGLFASYLPLTLSFKGHYRFSNILALVDETVTANHKRQEFFNWGPTKSKQTFLPFKFDYHEWPETQQVGPLKISLLDLQSRVDGYTLLLTTSRRGLQLVLEFHYDTRSYEANEIQRLLGQYEALLDSLVKNVETPIGQLNILSQNEQHQLVVEWNETSLPYRDDACIHELFAEQAALSPDAPAVAFEAQQLTFRELNERANQLAHHLRRLGAGPEKLVGLYLPRSIDLITALLAVWKAGAAYVPLDPMLPQQRLAFMLADAEASTVITNQSLRGNLPEDAGSCVCLDTDAEAIALESTVNPDSGTQPANLAYVLYTSGSTGRPKGVMVQHSSVVNLASALRSSVYAGQNAPLRVSVNAPLVFDASVKQLIQLIHGHTLDIVPEEVRIDGSELMKLINQRGINVLDCTPSQLKLLLAGDVFAEAKTDLKLILIGGEEVDQKTWEMLVNQPGTDYYNVYGPTECTVDATVSRISDSSSPTIGKPIGNIKTYIMDQEQHLAPIGVAGELHVGGAGVARGYWRRADLTAERFVPDAYSGVPGARVYRTGDRTRRMPDSNIEFLGRLDHQVKIRGYRTELGEIESVLVAHEAVREGVVIAREDETEPVRLVAYVVPHRRRMAKIEGRQRYQLPNGMAIVHQNRHETDYLYEEIHEKQIYLKHGLSLSADACVFDVGANIGMFTLFVIQHCPRARIYSFEPIEPIYQSLRLNAELYGTHVKTFPFGLSSEKKTEAFTFYPQYSMMSGLAAYADTSGDVEVVKEYMRRQEQPAAEVSTLLEHADGVLAERFRAQTYQSQLHTLSEVIRTENVERIDLLKIDVQRAELDVLNGIEQHDWEKIGQVVMEVHDGKGTENEGRVSAITTLLQNRGFTVIAEQEDELLGTDRHNLYAFKQNWINAEPATHVNDLALKSASVLTDVELRQSLQDKLPSYMIPASFVLLDKFPLSRNGKVDRAALPAPESLRPELKASFVAPQTRIERTIAAIWQQALHVDSVGVDDNFFELGGHSLLMVQVHSKLRATFEKEISMVDLFRHPTIKAMAKHLSQQGNNQPSYERVRDRAEKQKEALSRKRLNRKRVEAGI